MSCSSVLLGARITWNVGGPLWTGGSRTSGPRGTLPAGSAACRCLGCHTTKATLASTRLLRDGYALLIYFFYSNAQYSLVAIIFVFSSQSQSHGGAPCNPFVAYHLAHKGKATAADTQYNPEDGPDAYTNATAYTKVTEYTAAARERYGADFDPATQPLDTDLLMRLGGGRQHGRLYMAGSTVSSGSVPNLAEVRSRSTSSSIGIRPRQPTMAQLQVSTVQFIVHCPPCLCIV